MGTLESLSVFVQQQRKEVVIESILHIYIHNDCILVCPEAYTLCL